MGKIRGDVSRCPSEAGSCVVRKLCLKSRRVTELTNATGTITVITELETVSVVSLLAESMCCSP